MTCPHVCMRVCVCLTCGSVSRTQTQGLKTGNSLPLKPFPHLHNNTHTLTLLAVYVSLSCSLFVNGAINLEICMQKLYIFLLHTDKDTHNQAPLSVLCGRGASDLTQVDVISLSYFFV